MPILLSGWNGWREGEWRAPGCARGSASGSGWLRGSVKFKCRGDIGYNCMGRYDLHDRRMVSLLACPGELAAVHGKINETSKMSKL